MFILFYFIFVFYKCAKFSHDVATSMWPQLSYWAVPMLFAISLYMEEKTLMKLPSLFMISINSYHNQCFFLTKGPTFHVTANFFTSLISWRATHSLACQHFVLTKGPTFHVTANFYIIGFLTGWSYFSMSFEWPAAKVDCYRLSFDMWRVQKETLHTVNSARKQCYIGL